MRQTELLKSLLTHLTDTLLSIKPLKAMARESRADALLAKKTNRLNRALQKQVLTKESLKGSPGTTVRRFLAIGLYVVSVYWRFPLATVDGAGIPALSNSKTGKQGPTGVPGDGDP